MLKDEVGLTITGPALPRGHPDPLCYGYARNAVRDPSIWNRAHRVRSSAIRQSPIASRPGTPSPSRRRRYRKISSTRHTRARNSAVLSGYVWAVASEQTDWIPENSACILPPSVKSALWEIFSIFRGLVTIIMTFGTNGVFSRGAYNVA